MTVHDLSDDELRAQRGAELVRSAALGVSAPLALRERIERERVNARPAARRRRLRLGGALAGLVAAAALVVVLVAPGGMPAAPTVVQAAQLGLRPATASAPTRDPSDTDDVDTREGRVKFPYWARDTAWRASGVRTDSIAGRHATTVFYTAGAARISYTVVATPALAMPAGRWVDNRYTVLHHDGQTIVTWRNHGQTCIITASTSALPDSQLVSLAMRDSDES